MAGWGFSSLGLSISSLALDDELDETDTSSAAPAVGTSTLLAAAAAATTTRHDPSKRKSSALKEKVEGVKRALSPKRERRQPLTNDEINAKMKVVMKHKELWPKFKLKLAQSEHASNHQTVRAVMEEFLIENDHILVDENKKAEASSRRHRQRPSLFDALAGMTAEFEEEAKVLVEQDIMMAQKAKPPKTGAPNSKSTSSSSRRSRMERGSSARRMMNGFQMEAQHSQRSLMSESSVRSSAGARPSMMKQLSSRAMQNLAGESAEEIMTAAGSLDSSSGASSNNRSLRPSLMVKQLSNRAMNNLADEYFEDLKVDHSSDSSKGMGRPSLMVKQLSNRAMKNLSAETGDELTSSSSHSVRSAGSRRAGQMVKQLSSRAMKSLAGETRDDLTSNSSHSATSRRSRPSMVKQLSSRAMKNLAGETSGKSSITPPPPPSPAAAAAASPSPVIEFAKKISPRLSPKIRQSIADLSSEAMVPEKPDSPKITPRRSMKEERQDSLHSLDLNDPDPLENVGELEAASSHSQTSRRSRFAPDQTTSGGLDSLVGTIRRVSTMFGQDIQTELEVDLNSSIGSGLTFQSEKIGNNLYDSFASFTDEDIMDLHKSTTSIFSPIEEDEEDDEDGNSDENGDLVREAAKIAARRRERQEKLDGVEEAGESSEITSDEILGPPLNPPFNPRDFESEQDDEKFEGQSDSHSVPERSFSQESSDILHPQQEHKEESRKCATATADPEQEHSLESEKTVATGDDIL